MVIEKDKMVSLTYTLRESDFEGDIVEEVDNTNPLRFLFGTGQMLPNFEGNLLNLKEGDSFKFGLTAEEAYGEKREELVVDIPKHVFEVDGKLDENVCNVGNQVPMADAQGRRLLGVVLNVKNEAVCMDFNHPMAGADLFFAGKILEVKDPSPEELSMYLGDNGCTTCGGHETCGGQC